MKTKLNQFLVYDNSHQLSDFGHDDNNRFKNHQRKIT